MPWIDDKLDIVDQDKIKVEDDGLPRATLSQLCNRRGCKGGTYWMIEKKAPDELSVFDMDGNEEIWTLNGLQMGTPYKNKQYKRTKVKSKTESKPG